MPTSDLPPTSTLPSINPLIQNKTPVSSGNVPILPSINIKSKDFINAPEEYNIRARNEIKEKLFNSNDNKIDNSNIFKPKKTANSRSRNSSISYRSSNNGSTKNGKFFQTSNKSYVSHNLSEISSLNSYANASNDSSTLSSNNNHYFIQANMKSKNEQYDNGMTSIYLKDALPMNFNDYYFPENLMDKSQLLPNGRPKFSHRPGLVDWNLNDLRSLLIVDQLRNEWFGKQPTIYPEEIVITNSKNGVREKQNINFKIVVLPLNSDDNTIVNTLVYSDLYFEHGLDPHFKLMTAKYIVQNARKKYSALHGPNSVHFNMLLSKPEWRNIIDNYLLNIGVEAQCRLEFKIKCKEYKRWKQEQLLAQSKSQHQTDNTPIVITKEEKALLWQQIQKDVYNRVGLDWQPDTF
ncbi:hypothetical protein FOG48_01351 [Hanseniaspora uvarum]|nr:hypothetical protein FOG48_01351 [Hanseniaspora uvarum]